LTCSEIAMLGKASIMIPYPFAAGDHQTYNARTFSDIGASILIPDIDLAPGNLFEKLCMMFSDQSMTDRMGMLARTLSTPEATSQIYDELVRIVRERGGE
jgi:UDP-N-acetylglucosamine--N-acetylmuramyl-(pentapeptide) pyrophosphoryl-undecaprenol N-acetylglucosamine transferase